MTLGSGSKSESPLDVVEQLTHACKESRVDVVEAINEKIREIRLRRFYRCFPNDRLKQNQLRDFIRESIGVEADPSLLKAITLSIRGVRLPDSERVELEIEQEGRCALCGKVLDRSAQPHVDHKVPLALGGRNDPANLQLLCQRCNLGKGPLLDWLMGQPFFVACDVEVSPRLRYCVLARGGDGCSRDGCTETAATTELHVVPIIPVQRGGRLIFDNLQVACSRHYEQQRERWKREAVQSLKKMGSKRFGFELTR